MTDNNDNPPRNDQDDKKAAFRRRLYSRCYAQFADATIMRRQRQRTYRTTSAKTNDEDNHLQWIVPASKLRKSNIQSFHILDTSSRCLPEPCLHITGSYGNEYKVTFASKCISCTCDDTPNPCKHVLYIIQRLGVKIKSGLNIIDPVHIMHLLETVSLHRHMLDSKAAMLCLSYTSGKCGICPSFLKGTSSTCCNCAFIIHHSCVPDNGFSCPECRQPWQGIPIPFVGKHRNFHHILRHCRLPVADIPTQQQYPSQRRWRPRPNQQQQAKPLPPPPPPQLNPPIPEANNFSSSAHLIPGSPDKKINIKSEIREV
jgi:hypothetical protein